MSKSSCFIIDDGQVVASYCERIEQPESSYPRWLPAYALVKGVPETKVCCQELPDGKHEEGAYNNFEYVENRHGSLFTVFSCCTGIATLKTKVCHEKLVELIDQWASIEVTPIEQIFKMIEQSNNN